MYKPTNSEEVTAARRAFVASLAQLAGAMADVSRKWEDLQGVDYADAADAYPFPKEFDDTAGQVVAWRDACANKFDTGYNGE